MLIMVKTMAFPFQDSDVLMVLFTQLFGLMIFYIKYFVLLIFYGICFEVL
jgi:hypothetical protein